MLELVSIASCLALLAASTAAVCDWRTARIPNWLTLPPIALAPLAYGQALGWEQGARCVVATLLSGLVPYVLFRRGAMGGGDVKLFASLGAITSFDLLAGLEIQLIAFLFALVLAVFMLARHGVLLSFVRAAVTRPLQTLVPPRVAALGGAAPCASLRMGGAILLATGVFSAPYLAVAWKGL